MLQDWETDQSNGDITEAHAPALPDAIKRYLRDCKSRNLAPDTVNGYTRSLAHFERLVKVVDIAAIKVDAVREFRTRGPRHRGARANLRARGRCARKSNTSGIS
jgi:hypothetical protein